MTEEPHIEDHEDGRRTYGDQQFISAVEEHETPTTSDVARSVGCTPEAAMYRLTNLEDENRVSSTKIGSSKVWSLE